MEYVDYSAISKAIAPNWCSPWECEQRVPMIIARIVGRIGLKEYLNQSVDHQVEKLSLILAMRTGVPKEQVKLELVKISIVFSKLELFEEKYPGIVALLPTSETNHTIYPPNILASILGVTVQDALVIIKELFEDYTRLMDSEQMVVN